MSAFETWLSGKLQELETDEGVFLPYIVSILESEDETEEEKKEGLTGILADCLDNDEAIEAVLNDIMDNSRARWWSFRPLVLFSLFAKLFS